MQSTFHIKKYIFVLLFFFPGVHTIVDDPPLKIYPMSTLFPIILVLYIPAEANLLVEHQGALQRPKQSILKPALAAEHGWQADCCGHVAGGSALPKIRQEKARTGALADCV